MTQKIRSEQTDFGNGWIPSYNVSYHGAQAVYISTAAIDSPDYASYFTKGTKLKVTNGGTVKYFYIASTATGTIDIGGIFYDILIINLAGEVDLVDSAITEPHISYADCPQGFKRGEDWYRASGYASGTQANITDATYTKVLLGSESYDPNNNFASSRYTVPISGYYKIAGQVSLSGADLVDSKLLTTAIYKNGVLQTISFTGTSGSIAQSGSVASVLYLEAGDYVELFVRITHGNNLADIVDAGNSTYLTIQFVGV